MKELISILPELMLLLMLASVFGITFLITAEIINRVTLLKGKSRVIMASLISVFATVGTVLVLLMDSVTVPEGARRVAVNYSLLPGVFIGGVIILLELLVLEAAPLSDTKSKVSGKEREQSSMKSKPFGRPKNRGPAGTKAKQAAGKAGS